jgi:hypothetical protein
VIKTAAAAFTRFRFPIAPEVRIEHLDHATGMFKMPLKFTPMLRWNLRLSFDEFRR